MLDSKSSVDKENNNKLKEKVRPERISSNQRWVGKEYGLYFFQTSSYIYHAEIAKIYKNKSCYIGNLHLAG